MTRTERGGLRLRVGVSTVITSLALTALLWSTPSESPVADAAQRGDLDAVRALLTRGADVNAAQGDGMTALHWAALEGKEDMIAVLLYAGANPESTTRLGAYTALHLASRSGNTGAVAALLEGGANPNAMATTGVTPLHFAAAAGSAETIAALADAGADIDALEAASDQTPLMFAAAAGRTAAVSALLERGANVGVTSRVVDFQAYAQADGKDRRRRQELMTAVRKAKGEVDAEAPRTDPPATQIQPRQPAQTQAEDGKKPEQKPTQKPKKDADEDVELTGRAPAAEKPEKPAERPLGYNDLVGKQGGMTALHYAVRDGYEEVVHALLAAGADIDQPTGGDHSTPLLVATINGHYDVAMYLLAQGADPNIASEDGVAPLYATIANRWAPKALYPQPTAFKQQRTSYLEFMRALLDAGADVNTRVKTHVWYSSFNFDLLGVNFSGATPFWRAAYALDVPAMELLVAHGADPQIPTIKRPSRRYRRSGDAEKDKEKEDPSGLPPVEVGGPGIPPVVAAAGVGYGRARAGNSHRHAPDAWLPAAKYLIEVAGADPNARDQDGFSALHYAAARGDNELIKYLVAQGADPTVVARTGQTTVDMANGPIQRVQPFPLTIALLEGLGAMNNHNCVSC